MGTLGRLDNVQAVMRTLGLRAGLAALTAGLLAAALAGCASGRPGGGGPGTGAAPDGLEGRTFLSVEVTGATLVPGTQVRLSFDDGRMGASAGCNQMSGPYAWDGARLTVDDLAMTEMGCDPDRHAQDTWLADLLTSKPGLVLDGDSLVLTGTASEVRMSDREVVQPDRPLRGTRWEVDTIIQGEAASSTPDGASAYLVFEGPEPAAAINSVNGNTGCNQIVGDVVVTDDSITFSAVIGTQIACTGAADVLERALLALFDGRPIAYTIEADHLTLLNPDGDGVRLAAA